MEKQKTQLFNKINSKFMATDPEFVKLFTRRSPKCW